jgi:two-component system alkaline phosphatase synthesis response regulator PhoP
MDGIEACKQMKADPDFANTFIVFLTARSEEYSEIAGFQAGADDYIAKPIKPRVLVTRLSAILRRKEKVQPDTKLSIGDIVIDRETFLVFRRGEKNTICKERI